MHLWLATLYRRVYSKHWKAGMVCSPSLEWNFETLITLSPYFVIVHLCLSTWMRRRFEPSVKCARSERLHKKGHSQLYKLCNEQMLDCILFHRGNKLVRNCVNGISYHALRPVFALRRFWIYFANLTGRTQEQYVLSEFGNKFKSERFCKQLTTWESVVLSTGQI